MTDSTAFWYMHFHRSLDVFLIRMESESDRVNASEQAASGTSVRGQI